MAWTPAETTRVLTLEEAINQMMVMINNLNSKEQVRSLLLIKQNEIDSLTTRVANLEAQVLTLQNRDG
jgi:polyhydroxyalkanoate synthesis regulator phasin